MPARGAEGGGGPRARAAAARGERAERLRPPGPPEPAPPAATAQGAPWWPDPRENAPRRRWPAATGGGRGSRGLSPPWLLPSCGSAWLLPRLLPRLNPRLAPPPTPARLLPVPGFGSSAPLCPLSWCLPFPATCAPPVSSEFIPPATAPRLLFLPHQPPQPPSPLLVRPARLWHRGQNPVPAESGWPSSFLVAFGTKAHSWASLPMPAGYSCLSPALRKARPTS